MIAFIVAMGLLNFLLGYGLAMSLAEPPFCGLTLMGVAKSVWQELRNGYRWKKKTPADPQGESGTDDGAMVTVGMPPLTIHDLPATWREPLARASILPESFLEGVIEWLRIEMNLYRTQLITAEARARAVQANQDSAGALQLLTDLKCINGMFLTQQQEAAERIAQGMGRFENCEEVAKKLQAVLWDQSSHVEWIGQRMTSLETSKDLGVTGRNIMVELTQLGGVVNHLRDSLVALLEQVFSANEQFSRVEQPRQLDVCTGLPQQIGLAARLLETGGVPALAEGETRYAALVEVDGLRHINQRLGLRAGDSTLHTLGQYLRNMVADLSPTADITKMSGGMFLILLAAKSDSDAAEKLEYLRQSLEATSFRYQETELLISLSVGCTAMKEEKTVGEILGKTTSQLMEAKRLGRNLLVIAGKRYKPVGTPGNSEPVENVRVILSQQVEVADIAA